KLLGTLRGLEHSLDRTSQAAPVHRLEEIVRRVELKGLDGVLIIGCAEDDLRQGAGGNGVDDLESAAARHLDVEQNEVRLQSLDRLNRGQAVLCLADHGDTGMLSK